MDRRAYLSSNISPRIIVHITVNALRVHEVEQKKERLLIGPDYEDNGLVLPRYDGTI